MDLELNLCLKITGNPSQHPLHELTNHLLLHEIMHNLIFKLLSKWLGVRHFTDGFSQTLQHDRLWVISILGIYF